LGYVGTTRLGCLMYRALIILLSGCFSSVALAGQPTWSDIKSTTAWEHVTTKNHSQAGSVEVKRSTIGGIPCFLGRATAPLPVDALLDVVTDVASAKDWSSAGVTEAKLLGKVGTNVDYYQYLNVPSWTFASDRFWFLRGEIEKTGPNVVFRWDRLIDGGAYASTHKDVVTRNPGAVEPPVNVGGWEFRPGSAGTEISYYICTDVGGSIPRAVQSMATKGTLPDTVGDVVAEATRRQ
jgi:hypothetical protein